MIKLALLDLYNDTPNLGINNILDILKKYPEIEVSTFNVRAKCELPNLDYDIYISSGGPDSPLEGDGIWDRAYYHLMDKLWLHNQRSENKKHTLFICHSFQMICHHLSLGSVVMRQMESFGVYQVSSTEDGIQEETFKGLKPNFYVADFRHWQFINPYMERLNNLGCKILAVEKDLHPQETEKAIMAVRFSPEWLGVQFHPEADHDGMLDHMTKPDKKEIAIDKMGIERYNEMLSLIEDPEKLAQTYYTIIPNFLNTAISVALDYKNKTELVSK
jgi:GMP synthase-like glutamine amidotransferase